MAVTIRNAKTVPSLTRDATNYRFAAGTTESAQFGATCRCYASSCSSGRLGSYSDQRGCYLAGIDNQLFVSKYQLELPDEGKIRTFLEEQLRETRDEK